MMMQINLTRFSRFRDGLPADSAPPRKYAEQYRTMQEFEKLRDYLHQVGERVMPKEVEGVKTFRETVAGTKGETLRTRGVASGKCLLQLDVETEAGVQCRYERYKGRQTWTLNGPQGSTTYALTGDVLKVQ